MEENPKEKFERIKKAFNQSGFKSFIQDDVIHTLEVSKSFIEDFEYLIKLVDQLDKRNHIESINKGLMKIEVFMKDNPFIIKEEIKESKIDCDGNLIFFGELTHKQFYIKKESFDFYTLKEIKNNMEGK